MKPTTIGVALCTAVMAAVGAGCQGALPAARVATHVAATVEAAGATVTAVHEGLSAAEAAPTAVVAPAEARAAVRLATDELAKRLGLRPATIRLVRVKSVDWSDTSLGCPKPDMVYAQVITPGYVVVLWAQGTEYEYHTDEGRFAVWCEEQ